MSQLAQQMLKIFDGLHRAYGTYDLTRQKVEHKDGGDKITGRPKTIPAEVTEEIWDMHLEGINGVGIVPIRDDSSCCFGAIDIDVYSGLDIPKLIEGIHKQGLPLIPCRTKSGGIHCYMFLKEPVPAAKMREKLELFSSVLGFGGSEIFPKQNEILSDRGDMGQWINMPYYGAEDMGGTDRYAYDRNGAPMSIYEFIEAVNKIAFTAADFEAFTVRLLSDISDGPPCLQALITKGFSAGSRNDSIFNVAVYLKQSSPDNWETLVDEYNIKYFDPPLSTSEVSQCIKSVSRKDYNYTCSKYPMKDHCNMHLCRTRKHGISDLSGAILTGLTKYDSMPPVWFVDVDGGGRLELSTEELQSQAKFQKRCMESLNQMPHPVKPKTWALIIQNLLETVSIIEAPTDASPKGLMFEYLEKFCTGKAQAKVKDELLMGKPWTDSGKHHFRMADFMGFLERQRFNEFKVNRVSAMVKDVGATHKVVRIKGKTINVWSIDEFAKQTEKFDTPDIKDEEVF